MLRSVTIARVALAGWGALAATPAVAQDVQARIGTAEASVGALSERVRTIGQQAAAGAEQDDLATATARYQDAVYDFLVGRHEEAAEALFVLVRSRALAPLDLDWEASWYLAESLFLAGHLELAEATYQDIRADTGHVFRVDAVRRLLELYAGRANAADFDALFAEEVLRGEVTPTDVIRYDVARAFQRKGDRLRAKSWFSEIPAGSTWYLRAQYALGAMSVATGEDADLDVALDVFGAMIDVEPVAPEDAQVIDLARLAQGRIHEHRGAFGPAVAAYTAVSEDGAFVADKRHELAWVYIEQGAYQLALNEVQQFLEAFPNHRWAADLRLVQGHLQFQQGFFDDALVTYEDVSASYRPVQARFAEMAVARPGVRDAVREVLDAIAASEADAVSDDDAAPAEGAPTDAEEPPGEAAPAADEASTLPGWAVDMMLDDKDFARALGAYSTLLEQEADIEANEAILAALAPALGGDSADATVKDAMLEVVRARLDAVTQRLQLMDVSSTWLRQANAALATPTGALDARRSELQSQVARLEGVVGRVAAAKDADGAVDTLAIRSADALEAIEAAVGPLVADYRALRPEAGLDIDMDPTGARIDRLHVTVQRLSTDLARLSEDLRTLDATSFAALQALYREEVVNVAAQREALDAALEAAGPVTSWLFARSFDALAGVFGKSVLGADMGAVNVHWSRWVQTGAEREAISAERQAVLDEIAQQYGYVERQVTP